MTFCNRAAYLKDPVAIKAGQGSVDSGHCQYHCQYHRHLHPPHLRYRHCPRHCYHHCHHLLIS